MGEVKKIAFCNLYDSINRNNFLFENNNVSIGDDLLRPFQVLAEKAKSMGHLFATVDSLDLREADAVVFIDYPKKNNRYFKKAIELGLPCFLIQCESEVILPESWKIENHRHFEKIFTWYDPCIDNKKYFKLNFSHNIPQKLPVEAFKIKEKFCALIAGNKGSTHPLELYSKRVEAIRWYEENHPDKFDLYGIGWNKYFFKGNLTRYLNRFEKLRSLFWRHNFSTYKGMVERKNDVLKKYKYSICYENARDIPGYITEKIFDCFLAGVVPIYWGPQNVHDHIEKGTFINFCDFNDYNELHDYLVNMSQEEYDQFVKNIENYLNSDLAHQFSIDYFCETLLREIL